MSSSGLDLPGTRVPEGFQSLTKQDCRMGHEVRCRKNQITSVLSNRGLLDVFATEGSQVTGGQTALLRESQAGLRTSPGTWGMTLLLTCRTNRHGPGADLGINLVTALAVASVLAFFCSNIGVVWKFLCFQHTHGVRNVKPLWKCCPQPSNAQPRRQTATHVNWVR